MLRRFDVVVIGSGPNGLVAAALLAKAGRRVVVVERRDVAGGIAAREEFHPGYRTAGLVHDASQLAPEVVEELALAAHGLELADGPPDLLLLEEEGPGFRLAHDPEAARAEIAARSPRDAESYARFREFLGKLAPLARRFLAGEPPDPFATDLPGRLRAARDGLALRRLGRRTMLEVLRIPSMAAADWLSEWFESEALCAALAGPALLGSFAGPRSPASASLVLRRELLAGRVAAKGPGAIADALTAAARAHGAELRTASPAEAITVASGRARGVRLAGGETIEARAVVAACDPRTTFLALLPDASLPPRFAARLRAWRAEGTVAKVHLALRGPFAPSGRPGTVARLRTGATLGALERAFEPMKYGRAAEAPALDVLVPTAFDESLAPPGHAVVSVLAHGVPYRLAGGWSGEARERLAEVVVERLERAAPGTQGAIVGLEVLAPVDLETRWGLPSGHPDHGDQGLDQLLARPAPECAGHRTPIGGLFLGGMGSWPGGGVTGLPGRAAARAVLRTRP
jgi:phytoene dehydrogenase-like protein